MTRGHDTASLSQFASPLFQQFLAKGKFGEVVGMGETLFKDPSAKQRGWWTFTMFPNMSNIMSFPDCSSYFMTFHQSWPIMIKLWKLRAQLLTKRPMQSTLLRSKLSRRSRHMRQMPMRRSKAATTNLAWRDNMVKLPCVQGCSRQKFYNSPPGEEIQIAISGKAVDVVLRPAHTHTHTRRLNI